MIRSTLLLLICGLLFVSCKSDNPSNTATETTTDPAIKNLEDPGQAPQVAAGTDVDSSPLGTVKASLAKTLSGIMVESATLENKKLTIKYYPNAAAFAKVNPAVPMDEGMFKEYWALGDRAEKVITLIPAQMLHNFSFIEEVEAFLPTGETALSVKMTRDNITDFTGKSWEELKKMWSQFFRKDIMMNPAKRKAFYAKYVKSN